LALHQICSIASDSSGANAHAAYTRQAGRPETVEAMKLETTRKHQGAGGYRKSAKDNTHVWIIVCFLNSKVATCWYALQTVTSQCQHLSRVVGCPPAEACQRNPNCYKGRVSYKPRGRKPRGQIQPLPDLWRFEVPSNCSAAMQTCETNMQWSALRPPLRALFAIGNARWCANACPILCRQAHPN